MQNYGSVRLMGLGSRGFLPLTRKLPQIVVQRGSPHDLSRSVQNELDFALFCKVLGHHAKTCFSVPTPWVQLVAPGRIWWVQIAPTKLMSSALRSWPPLAVSCAQLLFSVASADPAGLVVASPIGFARLRWDGCL